MEKYICDNCGYSLEIELEKTDNGNMNCPICKQNMLTEEEFKTREEIAKAIAEDNETDEILSPQEDANEDLIELKQVLHDDFKREMKRAIDTIGMERTWKTIECLRPLKAQIEYRKVFFEVGGIVPEGEPIII